MTDALVCGVETEAILVAVCGYFFKLDLCLCANRNSAFAIILIE